MTSEEKGYWLPYVGELWDVATGGSSESVSVGHGTQISMAEVWAMAVDGHRCWPSDAGELVVFMVDVATVGHSASESSDGAWSHRFLLSNQECMTVPYLACQLSVFCKPD
jgi:hypothetical protein